MGRRRASRERTPMTFDEVRRFDGQINSAILQRLIDTVLTYDERRVMPEYGEADKRHVYGWSLGRLFADYNLTRATMFLFHHGRYLRFWGVTFGQWAIGVHRSSKVERS